MSQNISKKRKFVADGVFYAELNEFLTRELGEDGYSGVEVRVTPVRTEIIIRATRTQNVLGDRGRRIRELTSLVQKRFNFPKEEHVELYAERVLNRASCAVAQAESLCFKLKGGLAVRRACYGVLRYIMENGAKGCEIIVSGKLRAARAKAMKFKDGYMIKSGDAANHYVDTAVRHIKLKQGVLGIKVAIMLPYDPHGKNGPSKKQPDVVQVKEPKDDVAPAQPNQAFGQPMQQADPNPVVQQQPVQNFTAPQQKPREAFSLNKVSDYVRGYLLNKDDVNVDEFIQELQERWRFVDADESGLVSYDELRTAVWVSEPDNKGKPMPSGKFEPALQEIVDEIHDGVGKKEKFDIWDFVSFMLNDHALNDIVTIPVPPKSEGWAHVTAKM